MSLLDVLLPGILSIFLKLLDILLRLYMYFFPPVKPPFLKKVEIWFEFSNSRSYFAEPWFYGLENTAAVVAVLVVIVDEITKRRH